MPPMQLKKNSERGSTILLMLVTLASIGAAAAYILNLSSEAEKHLSREVKIENYKTIVQSIKDSLYTGTNCTAALGLPRNLSNSLIILPPDDMRNYVPNPFFPLPPSNLGARVSLNLGYGTAPGPIEFKLLPIQRWRANGVAMEDVRLRVDPTRVLRTNIRWVGSSTFMNAALGEITLIPSDPDIPLASGKYRDLRIKTLVYYYMQGGVPRVVGCFDPEGPANLCTANGGAYNPSPGIPEDQRCQPDLYCFAHTRRIVTNPSQCPAPYTARSIGALVITQGIPHLNPDGTLNMSGTHASAFEERYLCQWCR